MKIDKIIEKPFPLESLKQALKYLIKKIIVVFKINN